MSQVINTNQGDYVFEPKFFATGGKLIDKVVSKENLFLFKSVMEVNGIPFSLAYGTLLGAIRDKDFITHDEDTDVAILKEDESAFLSVLFALQEKGFVVGRYEDGLLSVVRDGEYIDIYIFKKAAFGYRKFGRTVLKEKYLLDVVECNFLGGVFAVPREHINYLLDHYGVEWMTPIKGAHACNPDLSQRFSRYLKCNFPRLFVILKNIKNWV